MHRNPWTIASFVVVALGLIAPAGLADQPGTYQGWIVDQKCGKENANENGVDCSKRCHDQGIALVFYDEKAEKIYQLEDQTKAAAHIGYVKIVGTLENGRLKIRTIEPV